MKTDPFPIPSVTVVDDVQLASMFVEAVSAILFFAGVGAVAIFVVFASLLSYLAFALIRAITIVIAGLRRPIV